MRAKRPEAGRLSVLLVCDDRRSHADNVRQHIAAFGRYSRHRVDTFNPRGLDRPVRLDLAAYDVVVVHYTILVTSPYLLPPWLRSRIAAFDGLKVQFLQDEYRWVDEITAASRALGVELLYSLVPQHTLASVYGERLPGVEIVTTLAGYVPVGAERRPARPLAGRPLDVVYRGRTVPYWLGELGQDKVAIASGFLARAASTGLRCDIASGEVDRIYGEAWYRFLESGRATLGTESGASIVDFDGSLQRRVDEYVTEHPTASFDDVEQAVLAPYEGNAVIRVVSPRVFEAAATRTAMVNFTGRYSDVIEPWRHYVPLEHDFSNFDEVVAAVLDEWRLEALTASAYRDLVASGRYSLRTFVASFDDAVEARARPRATRHAGRRRDLRPLVRETLDSRIGDRARANLRARVVARLLEGRPEVAAARAAAREALPAHLRDRVDEDLARLAIVVGVHEQTLPVQPPAFHAEICVDARTRQIAISSRAADDHRGAANERLRDDAESLLREGNLRGIVWMHRGVGTAVTVPYGAADATIEVGYHVVYGAYSFDALVELARRDPDVVLAVLEPLFRPPASVKPVSTPLVRRLRGDPWRAVLRALLTMRVVVQTGPLRRLLVGYLRHPALRSELPAEVVLAELLRLRLIHDAGRSATSTIAVSVDRDARVVFRTVGETDGRPPPTLPAPPGRIVWDNSSVGTVVDLSSRPHVTVGAGPGGVYEFVALPALLRSLPAAGADALAYALPPAPSSDRRPAQVRG